MSELSERPYLGMCFDVTAHGRKLGTFCECSGLTVDIGTEDYREGGNNHFVHKLPTYANTHPVVLKRGIDGQNGLWDWIRSFVEESRVQPATLTVMLRGPGASGEIRRVWVVDHAYPLKWEGPKLDAMSEQVAFESVEFAHRGVVQSR